MNRLGRERILPWRRVEGNRNGGVVTSERELIRSHHTRKMAFMFQKGKEGSSGEADKPGRRQRSALGCRLGGHLLRFSQGSWTTVTQPRWAARESAPMPLPHWFSTTASRNGEARKINL